MGQDPCRPRRRDVLRTGASAASIALLGSTAAAADDGTTGARTTSPATYEPLGVADVENAREAVPTPDGETVFVAAWTGFVTLDVSDPANPTVTNETLGLTDPDGTEVQQIADVKYDDGRLLVPTAYQGGGPRGFYLFDVSDPANPSQVGEWYPTPDHGNHNSFFHDDVAYLTGNTQDGPKVVMVDVSAEPFEELATWQPGDWDDDWAMPPNTAIHDLYVQGDYAYCAYWDSGTFILDVSDPSNPTFVSRVGDYTLEELNELSQQAYTEPLGNDHYVMVNEDATLMAEGGESWDVDGGDDTGGPSGITFYDVTDKANPERLGHIEPPASGDNTYGDDSVWTTSHNFDLRGDRLYASWYQGGVTMHDVSDPANPERIAWWSDHDQYAFWTAKRVVEDEFFVASSGGSNGTTTGVLTFPDDEGGRMENPPERLSWSTDGNYPSDGGGTTTTTSATTAPPTTTKVQTTAPPTDEPTDEPTDPPTTAVTEAEPTTAGSDGTATGGDDDGSIPGFGVLAALGGLGVGAARYLRSDDDN